MFDVSVTPASEIISAAFKWSHLVFASTTYNAGIFVAMDEFINDLVAHNIQNRTVAIIENGSWAATSGGLIRGKLEKCKDINILDLTVSIKSGLKPSQLADLEAVADAIAADFPRPEAGASRINSKPTGSTENKNSETNLIDHRAVYNFSYGLFILTAKDETKDNGCIINTAIEITSNPLRMSIAVNKANYTHDIILKTGEFNISILSTSAPFNVFEHFGFHSGRDVDKFANCTSDDRTTNGIKYIPKYTNSVLSGKVTDAYDYGTHTVFVADIIESFVLSNEPSVTYKYYFDNIKPKPQPQAKKKKGFVCKICGYVYEGDTLPEDFICPLCKHGAVDFEPIT